jgi:hypothetical protein
MITAVTAFVPIPDHPRSEEEYHRLAQPLLNMADSVPMMSAGGDIEHCWLYKHLCERYDLDTAYFSYSISDNPKKNSLWYHIVQAQKTEWLVSAAMVDPMADVFCWIDYGIFHVPGVTSHIIREFLKRANDEQTITIPGCWNEDYTYDDEHPCWRFCGGVMIVPRNYLDRLDQAMKREYIRWLELRHNISWEVNTLARVEKLNPNLPIWWYKADHDQTLFTNYKTTENADRAYTSTGIPRRELWQT